MTAPQKGRIFISYRRIDTSYAAGRTYDRLAAHFGEDAIFMDVEVIEGGLDFVKVLEDAVQSCDVLIALIGKQWLSTKDEGGNRRLDNPEDFVRIEIATALSRDIRVIPVLVDGIEMPRSTELPENLKPLARRNALQVNHHSFNPDVYRLITHIESALRKVEEPKVIKTQAARTAREKAGREAAEKAAREKAERIAAKKAAREKAKRESEERQAVRRASLAKKLSHAVSWLKSRGTKSMPVLRITGILGIIVILFWGGSFVIPKIIEIFTTVKPSVTSMVTATRVAATDVPSSPTITRTPKSITTPTKVKTPTPTSLPTEITDDFGVEMVLVPEGEFTMGSDSGNFDEKPAHQVYLGSYYIDKYEVTNARYADCVSEGVCRAPERNHSSTRDYYYGNPEFDDFPVIYVDWYQAQQYCKWRVARLPNEAEWENSSRDTVVRRYYIWGNIGYDNPGTWILDDTSVVWKLYENESESLFGVYGLTTNVWEWVNDWYSPTYYKSSPFENPLGPDIGTNRVLRGRVWSVGLGAFTTSPYRGGAVPDGTYYFVGFRCARDATP